MTHNRPSFDRENSITPPSSDFRPARLQRRSYYIALILAVLGLGVSLANIFRAPQKQQKFSLKELSYSQVINLFDHGAPEIIVSHPFGMDTLRNDSDYILLRDKIANQIESGATTVADHGNQEFTNWEEETSNQEAEGSLPVLRVDIAGSREAGSKLEFLIEDYDPEVFYYMDFGDGYRRKVDRNSVFTYSRSGTFTLHLYASIADKNLYDSYSKVLRISPSNKSAAVSRPQNQNTISDLFTEKEDEGLINKPVFDADEELGLVDPDFKELEEEETSEEEDDELLISDLGGNDGGNTESETSVEDLNEEKPKREPEEFVGTSVENEEPLGKAYFNAEMKPDFPGGVKAMGRYLRKNAVYPERASRAGIEGTVHVRVVVRADGSLSDLKVLKGLGYGCDDEALRLVSKMPRWIPGVQNGVSVPVYTVVRITFKLID
ncbi:MAG: energy transducer TonB [Bacteroidia bacterium]|nr:energy transducer TonB [Bacteroidia bacterium]